MHEEAAPVEQLVGVAQGGRDHRQAQQRADAEQVQAVPGGRGAAGVRCCHGLTAMARNAPSSGASARVSVP